MAELARGNVADRPWGKTLGTLALRGLTGQVNLHDGGKQYQVAFEGGVIVGAYSPLANDAAVRVAMQAGLVSSTQVGDISRRMAAAGGRDELEVLAEAAKLAPDMIARLRRRLVAQRAARTFSVEQGQFVVDDAVTVPVDPAAGLDVRTVIYMGAKGNLAEERLRREVDQLGGWFQIKPEALEDLAQYGFTETEKPVLRALLQGASIAELDGAGGELDARGMRAVVYALASCGACEVRAGGQGAAAQPAAAAAPAPAPRATPVPAPRATPPPAPAARPTPVPAAAAAPAPAPAAAPAPRATTPPPANVQRNQAAPLPKTIKENPEALKETQALIAQKLPLLGAADHFELLGVERGAPADAVRKQFFTLARKLHPDRLASLGLADDKRDAQRLFAEINSAFAVLNDPKQRESYLAMLDRGGEEALAEEEARGNELAMAAMRAEEAFKRGETALKREQLQLALNELTEAVRLAPTEVEYQALLAWAKFALAPDKNAVAAQTRRDLQRAAEAAARAISPRFYLGRVERVLGKDREALQWFQAVLKIKPSHPEAGTEARLLEQRLKGKK